MTTKYTDAPRTRVMTPASLNNGVHEYHSIGQTMAIAPKKGLFDDISIPQIIAGAAFDRDGACRCDGDSQPVGFGRNHR